MTTGLDVGVLEGMGVSVGSGVLVAFGVGDARGVLVADGTAWATCVCKAITVEATRDPAFGKCEWSKPMQ
jgi:hypothetical protein